MESVMALLQGFQIALSGWNIIYCAIGVTVGMLVGVLPGLGPVTATALLLPITFSLPPIPAIIMLAGIYYGSMYGGDDHFRPHQRAGRRRLGSHLL